MRRPTSHVPAPGSHRISRRQFNRLAAAGASAVLVAPGIVRGRSLNDKMNIAVIATGGRGGGNLGSVSGENIVALCDVFQPAVEAAAKRFPEAKKFNDFRKVFDRPQDFDAVVVSTCEHTHAMATMLALKHKKHVYCEKPLTHDVYEARQIRLAAQ
ncbi:MAG: Gfo/Idh/MocA family protein, partial [Thermoguttaceae bacterium]